MTINKNIETLIKQTKTDKAFFFFGFFIRCISVNLWHQRLY